MNSLAVALFLTGLVSVVFASGCVPSCLEGYVKWEDNCYKLYKVGTNWTNAEKHCREDAAHLASIHSAEENDFLESLTSEKDGDPHTWIGFNDYKEEGSFEWTDGSPVDYTNWEKPNEPNNHGSGEQCAELNYFETPGTWNDHFCHKKHYFVCKKCPYLNMGLL